MKRIILLLVGVVIFFPSCETDFDLNAEWKDITIVYGLLNQSESTHYVRINKAFLGDEDAYVMAQISDSSEYKNLKATIEQWKNGQKQKEYVLRDTLITNKDTGTFYAPNQLVYYFVEPNLDANSEYKLFIDIDNGKKKVSASTPVINDFTVKSPDKNPVDYSLPITFANNDNYIDFTSKWSAAANAKRYELTIIFYYTEITFSGDSSLNSIEWHAGTVKSTDMQAGTDMDIKISGESFYRRIANTIPSLDKNPSVRKRIVGNLDFIYNIAGEELNTYMEVNEPSTGIVQNRPEYTNIENGIGIFSCRYKKQILNRKLSTQTINELATGEIGGYTSNHGFCDASITAPHACD